MNILTTLLTAGVNTATTVANALGDDFMNESISTTSAMAGSFFNLPGTLNLLAFFFLNLLFVGIIVRFFYYPKSKRGDYFFTFTLIAISIFLLIYLLGGVKLKTGFALGLFAIFSIIRYRTEQVAIREMTYLFVIIAEATDGHYEVIDYDIDENGIITITAKSMSAFAIIRDSCPAPACDHDSPQTGVTPNYTPAIIAIVGFTAIAAFCIFKIRKASAK